MMLTQTTTPSNTNTHQSPAHPAELHAYQHLIELWAKSSSSRRETTADHYWKVLQQFAAAVDRKPLQDITRKDVIEFRDKAVSEGQSTTTGAHKVSILKTLFNVAINYELMTTNPATQIRAVKSDSKRRVAFTADELAHIFNSPIYTDHYRPQAGGRDAAYWLPLLALYTGARIEELAQLLVKDVHFVNELGHYLNITDDAEHAQLKNAASRRRVPVHQILIACGFIDYVQSVKPSKFLFPYLKPNPRGKLGGYFSNFFSVYLRQRVKITDTRKVFHSFRHTFKDVCRKVGIEEAVHDALTGHTNASVGRKYGNEQYPLEPLFEAMQHFDIADLDLSHLHTRPVAQLLKHDIKPISAYFGVLIAFVASKTMKAVAPFVVAQCNGAEAGIDIVSNQVIFGQLPANKQLLVNAWIEIHREELVANWYVGRATGEYFRVEPLR